MKKRIAVLLLAMALILSLCPTVFATAKIDVDKMTAMAGEQVVVTLTNETELTDITNLDYRVYYNKDCFAFTSGDDSEVLPLSNNNQPVAFDNSVPMHDDAGDYIAVNVVDPTSEGLNIAVGAVYTLTFTVKSDLTSQQSSNFEMVRHSVMDTTFKTGDDVDPVLRERVKVTSDVASVTVKPPAAQEKYTVALSDDFIGTDTAVPGTDYTFSAMDLRYDYTITAIMGDENVDVLDNGDGTYTIKNVSADLTITATKALKPVDENHILTKINAKAATCTESGNNEYYTCATCGKYFSDDAGNVEIAKDSWVIKATGIHSYDTGKVTKAATCTAAGTKTVTCTVCGATKTETIPAKGHTVVTDKAVVATYAKTGKTAGSHCSTCGTVIKAQTQVAMKKLTQAKITSVANTKDGIAIKWNKVTGATAYQVYRKVGTGSWKLIKTTTSTSMTNTGLTNGSKYQYKVRAIVKVDGTIVNKGAYSAIRTMYRLTRPTLASGTKNIATKKIVVKWNKNTKATGYQIKYVKGATVKTVKVTKASTLSKTLSKLTKGSTYKVSVRSYKTVSGTTYYSAYSAVKSVKVSK